VPSAEHEDRAPAEHKYEGRVTTLDELGEAMTLDATDNKGAGPRSRHAWSIPEAIRIFPSRSRTRIELPGSGTRK
jgi:hypothetical protein